MIDNFAASRIEPELKHFSLPWRDLPGVLPDGAEIFAIGDVHGQADLLAAALTSIAQTPRTAPVRHLVFLGDLIDRGPKSIASIHLALDGLTLPEDTESGRSNFADHSSRSLRLEGFVARLLTQAPDIVLIALTAVAGGAAGPVARWMEGTADAVAIGTRYRSTRQVIGVLETAPERRSTMLLELVNGQPLYVQGRDDPVYLNLNIPPMAQLPPQMRSSLYRFNQVTVLWTALHLTATDHRILISLAQQPEQTMGWYAESFDLPAWQGLPVFMPPEGSGGELFAEARAACVDYCGPNSYEVRLLDRGIATSHGQMPQGQGTGAL